MESMSNPGRNSNFYHYSFKNDFIKYSFLKKLLTIIFLPLVPIIIVSKGFQIRSWNNKGGDHPPSAKKNYIIMILIYLIFQLPVFITILYFYISIILFPITLLFAIYFHRKDYSKEELKHGTKSEEFRVIGFKKFSLTFIGLLFFTILFTGFGFLLLLTITSMIFVLFPKIYKKLYFIPSKFLILSFSFFNFLNYIPGINVSGEWFIEKDSEIKIMRGPFDIIKHILSNYEPFLILNVGISALLVRILLWFRHDPQDVKILTPEALSGWGFLSIFMIVPIIMSIYFVWVWTWEDAEIKVAKAKISTGSQSESQIKETTLLVPASNSIRRLFSYAFGLTPIIWLVDKMSNSTVENFKATGFVGMAIIIALAFVFTGISTIFMGIMYYRSDVHEELVNKLRKEIKELNKTANLPIKVCYSGIQEVESF